MFQKSVKNYLSGFILTTLMSFSCVYALISSLYGAYPAKGIFLLVLFSSAVISLLFYNSITTRISIAALFLSITVYILYLADKDLLGTVYENIVELFEWIYNYTNGAEYLNLLYINYIAVMLSIFVSLIVYIFTVKYFCFPFVLVSGSAIFVAQWMLDYFVSYLAFYTFLFIILIYYSIYIYRDKSKNIKNYYASQAALHIWLTPFCAVILLLAFLIPAPSKPIEWEWLDKKINDFISSIDEQFNYQSFEYFSLASSGFGRNNNTLGGTVEPDSTLVLTVDAPRTTYLRGTAKDIYTGSAWISSNKDMLPIDDPVSGVYRDAEEMIEGMKLLTGQAYYFNDYFYRDTYRITFQNIKTKSLFVPIKSNRYYFIGPKNPVVPLVDYYEILTSKKRLSKGFYYTVDAFGVKYNDSNFINIMRKSRKGFYKEILDHIDSDLRGPSEANQNIFLIEGADNKMLPVNYKILKGMAENSDRIYANYLQLPDTLPDRVREFTKKLTAYCENDYDRARTIEQYLSSNYAYTLKPKPVPEDRDFVDYFLFDSKEGYCSYYATAMAVMARTVGLPARYIEGYMLPSTPAYDNTYEITNEQAHAWVEIYFEGFGWLSFEPTSPFGSGFYEDTEITPIYSTDFINDPAYEDYLEKLEDYRERNRNIDFEPGYTGAYSNKGIDYYAIIKYTFIILLLLFVLNIPVRFIAVRIRFLMVKRSDEKKCVLYLYKLYLKVLALQGYVLNPGETPSAFAKRVDRILYFGDHTFADITGVFLKARYSKSLPEKNEKKMVVSFYRGFLRESRMNMGNFKYFIHRYLLWRF